MSVYLHMQFAIVVTIHTVAISLSLSYQIKGMTMPTFCMVAVFTPSSAKDSRVASTLHVQYLYGTGDCKKYV